MILIEDVICRIEECWAACSGFVGVGIKYSKDGGSSKWLSIIDGEGIEEFFLSEDDYIEKKFKPGISDDEAEEICNQEEAIRIDSFEGVSLEGGYKKIINGFNDSTDEDVKRLLSYLFIVTLCGREDTEKYIQLGKGKNINDMELPELNRFIEK
ncbi:hypothetical protein [Butyrivibrio sp. AE3009]|uniref:hypothetical protein n=1 Tax=Butyrivibrio sp. AE3009 TaxID=1280666 RepID=UPI0003B46383|nr:hypothetical protein [Butyrivibrio sp. AE3009]